MTPREGSAGAPRFLFSRDPTSGILSRRLVREPEESARP
jgi:hypothetical protein